MENVNPILVVSFIVYTLGIVFVGLYSAKLRKETKDDFVLANRELGPWTSALSASASSESGWVMLGLVGEAYLFGFAAFWIIPGIAMGYIVNWWFIAERLRKSTLEYNAVTLPQYLGARFGKNSKAIQFISIIIITAAMLGYVAAQMNAAGKAFDAVFHLPYWIGVLVGAVVILAYTVTGGFRAICWTDVIQAGFMFVALIVMPFIVLFNVGGWSEFIAGASAVDPNVTSWTHAETGFAAFGFVIGLLGIGLGYPGQPQVLARFMALKDRASVNRGRIISIVWMVLVYFGAVFFGLFAKAYFGILEDPEQALPMAVAEFLPPILGGFVIAAIVSAICSTADSQLIVVSSTFSRDLFPYFKKYRESEQRGYETTLFHDRTVLAVLGIISVFFALTENRVIFDFVLYAWSALGASFGPVLLLGLLWKGANKYGAIAGMLTGSLVTVIWKETAVLTAIVYELVPAFILALIMTWLVSIVTRGKVTESAKV